MVFRWRYFDEMGHERSGPDETFADQTEAEAWFTDIWPQLLADGIHAVTLLEIGEGTQREVYGPMSLHEQA